MDFPDVHGWDVTPKEAIALQKELAGQVVVRDILPRPVRRVAGVDVPCKRGGRRFFVALVLRCLTRYRLPEPTRLAHQLANRCRLEAKRQEAVAIADA